MTRLVSTVSLSWPEKAGNREIKLKHQATRWIYTEHLPGKKVSTYYQDHQISDYWWVLWINLPDIPNNVQIIEGGRGAAPSHPLDCVLLLKRFAADSDLAQDCLIWCNTSRFMTCTGILNTNIADILNISCLNYLCNTLKMGLRCQEPLVSFRHCYCAMLGPVPTVPRALNGPDRKKKMVYLELAQILLRKWPSESTARSVRFIQHLCRNEPPGPLVQLSWLERPPEPLVQINLDLPPALGRLAPVMRFNARHR